MTYSSEVQDLIHKRIVARKMKDYALSDALRNQLIAIGFDVEDTENDMNVIKKNPYRNFLTLFGSGEISPIGRKIHEYALKAIGLKSVRIAIISTPAGFQPNVVKVHEEIKDFFINHLSNFHPSVSILYANTREEANNQEIVSRLDDSDYIFMGPGSPTYAVKQLKDTLLLNKIISLVKSGKSLSLSSAAALSFSKYCLPVYEIFKVGEDLHWVDGLNVYEKILGKEMTIIPHFNNTEGGVKNDTSRCYMGKNRFEKLKKMLPHTIFMQGIDEMTAQIWDLTAHEKITLGKGNVISI